MKIRFHGACLDREGRVTPCSSPGCHKNTDCSPGLISHPARGSFLGNASPERVFVGVLQKINRRRFEVVVFAQNTPQTPPGVAILAAADRVVFLPGHDGLASIGEPTHIGGGGVVSMGMPSLHDSRRAIQAEKVGVIHIEKGMAMPPRLLVHQAIACRFRLTHNLSRDQIGPIIIFLVTEVEEFFVPSNNQRSSSIIITRA